MAAITSSAFLDYLKRSKLLTAEQFEVAARIGKQVGDPKQLARQLIKRNLLTKWQARQLLAGGYLLTLGKYTLQDQLGSSELGRVYLAYHAQLSRQVAIRTLSRRYTRREDRVQQFLDEAREAAVLDHRNIVHIYDIDREGKRFYIVMEYVEGRDLERVVTEDGPLLADHAARLIRQAAEGLCHAHRHEMVHRELKPRNLVVDAQGELKILGLGLRLLSLQGDASDEQGSPSLEAANFQAPEQRLDPSEVDGRADIYALGAIAHFLLTGKAPTMPLDTPSAALEMTEPDEQRFEVLRQSAPEPLAQVVSKMLAVDPARRYRTAADVATDLTSWIRTERRGGSNPASNSKTASAPSTDGSESLVAASFPRSATSAPSKALPQAKPLAESAAVTAAAKTDERADLFFDLDRDAAEAMSEHEFQISIAPQRPRGPRRAIKPRITPPRQDGQSSPEAASKAADSRVSIPLIVGLAAMGAVILLGTVVAGAWFVYSRVVRPDATKVAGASLEQALNDTPQNAGAAATTSSVAGQANDQQPPPEKSAPPSAAPPAPEKESVDGVTEVIDPPAADAPPPDAPRTGAGQTATPAPAAGEEKPAAAGENSASPDAEHNVAPQKEAGARQPEGAKAAEEGGDGPSAAPAVKPFQDLPRVVELLPKPGDKANVEPLTLGDIHLAPEALCFIQLAGGDHAARGAAAFEMNNANNGTAERAWEVTLKGAANEEPVLVARLALEGEKLVFAWTEAGVENPTATSLRNCALQISAGTDTHNLPLRAAAQATPLSVNLDGRARKESIRISDLPEADQIRVEITDLSGFPPAFFNPSPTIDAAKGSIWIVLGKVGEEQALRFRVDVAATRALTLAASPHLQFEPQGKPDRYVHAKVKKMLAGLLPARLATAQAVEQLKQLKSQARDKRQQQQLDRQLNLAEQDLLVKEAALRKGEQLEQVYQDLNGKAEIHYRVFYNAGDVAVELARSN